MKYIIGLIDKDKHSESLVSFLLFWHVWRNKRWQKLNIFGITTHLIFWRSFLFAEEIFLEELPKENEIIKSRLFLIIAMYVH
jgi:hypothetical protein